MKNTKDKQKLWRLTVAAVALSAPLAACTAATETDAVATDVATTKSTDATLPARPGPDNTGPRDQSTLKPVKGAAITEEGAVWEDVSISGMVTIKADNVTIRNFHLDAKDGYYGIKIDKGRRGIRIENGEIVNFKSAAILGMGFHAIALNIHESGGDGIKPQGEGGPVIVERSWIHHLGKNEGAHADAIQSVSADGLTFRHNYFDLESDPQPPYKANTNFMLQTKPGPLRNVLIEENWIDGGGWMMYVPKDAENVRVLNNKFSRDYRFGVINGLDAATFEGNVWEDTGEPIEFNERGLAIDPTHVKPKRGSKGKK